MSGLPMASQIETASGSGRFAPRETTKASIVEDGADRPELRPVRRARLVAVRGVVWGALVVVAEDGHQGLRRHLLPRLHGERIVGAELPRPAGEEAQPPPMAQGVAVGGGLAVRGPLEGPLEIERPVLGRVVPAVLRGVFDDVRAAHEMVRVVRADAADRVMVGDDGHLVVGDALGVPAAAPEDGQHPGLVLVGDRVGPARGAVAVLFDEPARDPDGLARRRRLLGHEPPEHPADAAVGVVLGGHARRAAVGGDENAVVVDEAVGELLGRRLDPEKAVRPAVGFVEGALAEVDLLGRAVVAGLDLAQVDDDVAPVVFVVGDDDRAVGAGLPADEDGETLAVPAPGGRGERGQGEDERNDGDDRLLGVFMAPMLLPEAGPRSSSWVQDGRRLRLRS